MKCADLPRRLFQVLPTASHRRPSRRRLAFESFEDKLLLSALYVAPGGSDSANGSALHPWATIQKAANTVAAGDTVHVAPGQYNAPVVNNTSGTAGAPITFISDVPRGAKIYATLSQAPAKEIWINRGNYVTIQGFDISGGTGMIIGISNSASYCKFIGNYIHDIPAPDSSTGGAGIETWSYTTTGNVISGNVVGHIGIGPNFRVHGIYVSDANETIQNNICYGNSGWGIHTWHNVTHAVISNNLVFANGEGGILLGNGDAPRSVTCDNNVVSNNIAIYNNGSDEEGYGISEQGASGLNNRYLNNLVYRNSSGGFSLQHGLVATGTVVANPKFINYQGNGTGNYHLAPGSPCIGTGASQEAPATDIGVSRPQGAGLYIGPYE